MSITVQDKIVVSELVPITLGVIRTLYRDDLLQSRDHAVTYENLGPGTISDIYIEDSIDGGNTYTKIAASEITNIVPLGREKAKFTTRPSKAAVAYGLGSRIQASATVPTTVKVTIHRSDDGTPVNI